MKGEFDKVNWIEDDDVAARALAYLHGELGNFEKDQFEQELSENPHWKPGFEAMKKLVSASNLLGKTDENFRLSSERRQALLSKLSSTSAEKKSRKITLKIRPWLQFGAAATVATLGLGLVFLKSSLMTKLSSERTLSVTKSSVSKSDMQEVQLPALPEVLDEESIELDRFNFQEASPAEAAASASILGRATAPKPASQVETPIAGIQIPKADDNFAIGAGFGDESEGADFFAGGTVTGKKRHSNKDFAVSDEIIDNPDLLDDLKPSYSGAAMSPQHAKNVETVMDLNERSEGDLALGRYDEALKNAEDVLRIDPYNRDARRLMEKIGGEKARHYESGYDQSRAALLAQVEKSWVADEGKKADHNKRLEVVEKLKEIHKKVAKQSAIVDAKRERLTQFSEENGIIYVPSSSPTGKDREFEDYIEKKKALVNLEQSQAEIKGQIESLEELRDDDLLEYAAEIELPENVTKRLYPELKDIRQKRAKLLASGVGESHPAIVGIDRNIKNLEEQSSDGVVSLRNTLRTYAAQMESQIEAQQKLVEAEKHKTELKGLIDQKYRKISEEYERERLKWEEMRDKIFEEEQELFKEIDVKPAKLLANVPAALPFDEEVLSSVEPVSTFSLHVGEVSFQVAANALLEEGRWPDPSAIRPEEFYNGFDLGETFTDSAVRCRILQSQHPFAQGRNLMKLGVKAGSIGRSGNQALNLVILIDQSGSMKRHDRQVIMEAALISLASLLTEQDRVSVVGFARTPRLLADRLDGREFLRIIPTLINLPAQGGTNLEQAIKLGGQLARRMKVAGSQNRVLLFTDGAANLGQADPETLAAQVDELRMSGISLDTCGIGLPEMDDERLSAISKTGDGRYYALNRPEEADDKFANRLAGAFRPAAKDLKVQVVFNPRRVPSYRLVGFDKHRLNKEDFRNDQVDAAEISAAETGNALYEYQVNDAGEGAVGEVYVRFKVPSTGEVVERSWTIPYRPQLRPFEDAEPSLILPASAAFVAERLRGGKAGARVNLAELETQLRKLTLQISDQKKFKQLERMIPAMRRIESQR